MAARRNIADGRPRKVYFVNDFLGQAIKRDEADYLSGGDPHELWYRFGGRSQGYVGNNGTIDTDYAKSIADRTATSGTGAFHNGAATGSSFADFDLATDAINSYEQGSRGGTYTVQSGDTLASIASALWGDSALWYKLAEINGLSAESALIEGQPLLIPVGVVRNTNNASTFQPYDPLEVLGETAPTTPVTPKPKKAKCGGFGQILLAVIAVVVTIYTAGAATNALAAMGWTTTTAAGATVASAAATVVGGAIGGAAGSIVSQGIGVMTGIQEKFSWNAVGLAAIGGGIGAALPAESLTWYQAAARGVAQNVITQGIGVATGMQREFSWAGVAAAGVGAALGNVAGKLFDVKPFVGPNADFSIGNVAEHVGVGMASAIGNAAARSLIEGTDFGDNVMAALPDVIGQTIGDAIAGGISNRISEARRARLQAAEATNAREVAQQMGIPIDFDVERLRAQHIPAGSYEIVIGADGKGFHYTAASIAHNGHLVPIEGATDGANDDIGTIVADDDGANAHMRRYTVDWVAPDGQLPVSFIRSGDGPRVLSTLGRNETYGLSIAVGRFELSAADRAVAEVGRQRVIAERRADYAAWVAQENAAWREQANAFDRDALVAVAHIMPVIGTYYAAKEFSAHPDGWNAAGLGLSLFGDGAMAVSALRGAAMFRGAGGVRAAVPETRALGSSDGLPYAREVLDGGSGTAIAGHGGFVPGSGKFVVPEGTAITLPRDGIGLLDETGQFIERGDWDGLAEAAKFDPAIADNIEGMTTWLPGAEIWNYTLRAPNLLGVYRASTTVDRSTLLSSILEPHMGCVQWAACTITLPR